MSHSNCMILQIIIGKWLFLAYKGCFLVGISTWIYIEKGIQPEGFNNLQKKNCLVKIRLSLHPLRFEGSNINEEINNMMDGIPEDESNGYMCNNCDGATINGTLKRTFFDFMNEGMNEEGNGEKEEERGDNENKRRNSHIPSKGRFV